MALQQNGISVVRVSDDERTIRFFVGDVDIRLQWDADRRAFFDRGRSTLSKRTSRPFIPRESYRNMMAQAHAIAGRHGWK